MIEHKYKLGQEVWYQVTAEVKGTKIKLSSWEKFTVARVELASDSEKTYCAYGLTTDVTGPWHSGSGIQFTGVKEEDLKEEKPSESTSTIR